MERYFTGPTITAEVPKTAEENPHAPRDTKDSGASRVGNTKSTSQENRSTGNGVDPLSRSKMVLKDDLWKGQEHGAAFESSPAHARFLRPLCERFSTGQKSQIHVRSGELL